MAIKEFENFEYEFAKKQNEQKKKTIRYGLLAFAGIILIFACWSFFSSLNIFNSTQTTVTQPVRDPNEIDQQIKDANQSAIDRYASVRIPYTDPSGNFRIDFMTPYVSGRIVVYVLKENGREDSIRRATEIINAARETVTIESVAYVNSY